MDGWKLEEKTYINKRTVREKYVLDPSEMLDHATYMTAYYGARDNAMGRIGNPSFAATLFTDTMRNNVASDNGVYVSTTASAATPYRNAEVAHRFVFDVSKFMVPPKVIAKIEFGWDGYSTNAKGGVYVQTPTAWRSVTSSLPTSDGVGFEFKDVLISPVGLTVGRKFNFGVYSYDTATEEEVSVTLYTDYVYVIVTYRFTDLVNTPVVKPKVIGVSGYER